MLLPVAHDVVAELAVGAFDVAVDLAGGGLDAVIDELEVVHERLDVRVHLGLGRQRHLAVLGDEVALGELGEGLLDDARALLHLFDADKVAVVAIAHRAHGHIEVVLVVPRVRMILADVVADARAAKTRTHPAVGERIFLREDAHVLEPVGEDGVAGEQVLHLEGDLADPVEGLPAAGVEVVGHVLGDPADADVAHGQARAADRVEKIVDFLAGAEDHEEGRDGAEVDHVR